MKINILTLFPNIFSGFLSETLINKAIIKGLISIDTTQIRDFADPPHYKVDDTPYGGGPGMVMKSEPIVLAVENVKKTLPNAKVILTSATGETYSQQKAIKLSKHDQLIFICGRYEGVDQRVVDLVVDEEISIGNYVLMGGEIPTMVILESVFRLVPGFIGNSESIINDSFASNNSNNESSPYLEYPQYTKPFEYRGLSVPQTLTSGNHQEILKWRNIQSRLKSKPCK